MAKYVAKIPIGGNSFRYFYSAEEYGAYKALKNKASAVVKLKKGKGKKSKGKKIKIPSGHIAKASVGQVVSGYTGAGKPEGMSDETWARYNKFWNATSTLKSKKKKNPFLKTKLAYSLDKRRQALKSSHSSGSFNGGN